MFSIINQHNQLNIQPAARETRTSWLAGRVSSHIGCCLLPRRRRPLTSSSPCWMVLLSSCPTWAIRAATHGSGRHDVRDVRCCMCRLAAAMLAAACLYARWRLAQARRDQKHMHVKEQARNGTLRFAPGAEGDPSRARNGVPLGVSAGGLLGSCAVSPALPAAPSSLSSSRLPTPAPRLAGISQALAAQQHTGPYSRGIARHTPAAHAFLRGWRQGLGLARAPAQPSAAPCTPWPGETTERLQ